MTQWLFDDFALPAVPAVWQRENGSTGGTCGSRHTHLPSGMIVLHCGHPTANFPYYIETPSGASIYAPNGRGFQNLKDAKTHVETLWRTH